MKFEVGEIVRYLQNHHTGEVVEAHQRKGARPEDRVAFGGGAVDDGRAERLVREVDLEAADVGLRSHEHSENVYQRHLAREHWGEGDYGDDPAHPDGCFFCGSYSHPSDCCPDPQAVEEYWEDGS